MSERIDIPFHALNDEALGDVALAIVACLDGLSVGQSFVALDMARQLIGATQRVSVNTPEYAAIAAFAGRRHASAE